VGGKGTESKALTIQNKRKKRWERKEKPGEDKYNCQEGNKSAPKRPKKPITGAPYYKTSRGVAAKELVQPVFRRGTGTQNMNIEKKEESLEGTGGGKRKFGGVQRLKGL